MVELISKLTANHAILLVEHDMDAVFHLAQVLTVMVNGKLLASGAPEAIRANREVQSAYLGSADRVSMTDAPIIEARELHSLLRRKPYFARRRFFRARR